MIAVVIAGAPSVLLQGPPMPADGPMVTSLVLLIPVALLVLVGVWGWRNAASLAGQLPLDDRTREKRRQVYRRGAATCLIGAAALVLLIVLSYFSLG